MRHYTSFRPRMQQPPSSSSEGQQPFYCLPTEMPLCQLHTTTKNNAFILNLVVFSPEGERLYYSFEFTPSLEHTHVKINSHSPLLFFSTLNTDCKSHSSSRPYKACIKIIMQSRVPGVREINVGQPQEISITSANAHFTGLGHPCDSDVQQTLLAHLLPDWAANLQTQPHSLICHEHRIWS